MFLSHISSIEIQLKQTKMEHQEKINHMKSQLQYLSKNIETDAKKQNCPKILP